MPPADPPLSVAQAAREYGIPKRTIQWALLQGQLAAHKLPGSTAAWVIDRANFEAWANQREDTSA